MAGELPDTVREQTADDTEMTVSIGPSATPWHELFRELAQLSAQLVRVQQKAAARCADVETSVAVTGRVDAGLECTLARIEHKIDSLAVQLSASKRPLPGAESASDRDQPSGAAHGADALPAAVELQLTKLASLIQQLTVALPGSPSSGAATPKGGVVDVEQHGEMERWGRVILGDELWSHPEIEADRQRLLEGFLKRDPAVFALAGCLLTFQSSPPERIPQLIKELGEAYYRWQPRTTASVLPFEAALSSWAVKVSESGGVRNRIELVRPGSRFNPQQHKTQERGVEVTQALGWVVIREDGSVFQKASVAVQ